MSSAQPQVWPAEMDRLARAHDFGPRVLRDRSKPGKGLISGTLAFMGLAALIIIPGVYASALLVVVLGLLPLILGCLSGLLWIFRKHEEVLWLGLYERGLVLVSTRQEPVVLRWADVDTVTIDDRRVGSGVGSVSVHKTTLWGRSTEVVLDDKFESVEQSARRAAELVAAVMVPRMRAALNAGTALSFGSLMTIHRDWIDYGGQRLDWTQVASITVRDGVLRIVRDGSKKPWAEVVLPLFPNLLVFISVTKSLRARRNPA